MVIINVDVILELSQYLDIISLLYLTHSSSVAFRASREYSFWSPHNLHSSVGLAAFLPDDHVGPWRSYSGDEVRQAVIKMRNFKDRWNSERVRATHRVHLGRYNSLVVIPGSRWLYNFHHDTSIGIVDGKTGMSTMQELDVGPVEATYTEQLPVACSLEPNRILMGGSGEDDSGNWSFALFEIILSLVDNAGQPYIAANATQLRLWENIPESPIALMNSEFLVLESEDDALPKLGIYHIPSARHWEWREVPEQQRTILLDQWCILTIGRQPQGIGLVAIHLPSLLSHPDPTLQDSSIPAGTTLTTDRQYPHGRHSIDVLPSRNLASPGDISSEYTVIIYNANQRVSFDIQLDAVPGSPYGNVMCAGAETTLPSDKTLRLGLSSRFPTSNNDIPESLEDASPAPVWVTTTLAAFDALVAGFDANNYIKILRMVDLDNGGHARMLEWKAPLKPRAGSSAMAEMDDQGNRDEIRVLPDWNSNIGMLLLRGHPLTGGVQEYQTCWF